MHIRWRGLELPSSVTSDAKTLTGTYGKFVAEPFERGFGTTVGNSLRRVLLSSLEGSAVTQIKVGSALHEFSTVKGVLEDVTDIVLAVKSLVVKNHSDSTRVIRVEKSTKGPITGADVQTDEAVEVVSKDLVLATLTDDVPFELEMVVENGRGYVPASEHSPDVQEIGIIPVDAVFSPVTRVRYEVEETRVGQKTNYDKLTMEIWTDGTVTPDMALVEAAKILRKHLNPFVGYTQQGAAVNLPPVIDWTKITPEPSTVLTWEVSQLELSVRAQNCLSSAGIRKVSELVVLTREQLLEMRNAGEQTAEEIEAKLNELGLKLGVLPVEAWSPPAAPTRFRFCRPNPPPPSFSQPPTVPALTARPQSVRLKDLTHAPSS
jgi:DNA-directed RNA polymerase subunit alpha